MIQLPRIIGYPGAVNGDGLPSESAMDKHIERTMPIAKITPCEQTPNLGLEIFSLQPSWDKYTDYLSDNFVLPFGTDPFLKIMFLDISPFSESYSNSYAPSEILSKFTEGASAAASEMMYVTNMNPQQLVDAASKKDGAVGAAGTMAKGAANLAEKGAAALIGDKLAGQAREAILNGQRIDFPMMWKGSNYTAQYEIAVRLYNPSPKNDDLYETLIVGPYIALLALALPKTVGNDTFSYQWPFLIHFEVPGVVDLKAGYISSISVIKGGDVNDRSWIGRPNIIDLRISIGSLYSTFLMTKSASTSGQPILMDQYNALYGDMDRSITAGPEGGYIDNGPSAPSAGPITSAADTNNAPAGRGPNSQQSEAGNALK